MLKTLSLPSPESERSDSNNNLPALEAIRTQARHWLARAQQPLDPTLDPPFQLMLWGMDHGLAVQDPGYQQQLRESVEFLAFQVDDPNQALAYLLEPPDNPANVRISPQQFQQQRNPLQASQSLLSALDQAMSADPNLEGWPPVFPKAED